MSSTGHSLTLGESDNYGFTSALTDRYRKMKKKVFDFSPSYYSSMEDIERWLKKEGLLDQQSGYANKNFQLIIEVLEED